MILYLPTTGLWKTKNKFDSPATGDFYLINYNKYNITLLISYDALVTY